MSAWTSDSGSLGFRLPVLSPELLFTTVALVVGGGLGVEMHSELLLIIVGAAASLIVLSRWPEFLLVLFIAEGTLKALPPFTSIPLNLLIISFGLVVAACALQIRRYGLPEIPLSSGFIIIVAVLLVVATIKTTLPGGTYKAVDFEFVCGTMFFAPLILVRDSKSLGRVALGMVVVGIIVAKAAKPSLDPSEPLVIPGGDEITAALWPAFGGLAAFTCLAMRRRGAWRLVFMALGISLMGLSVRAGSRGVLVSMAAALVVSVFVLIAPSRKRWTAATLVAVAVGTLVLIAPTVLHHVRGNIDPAALKRYTRITNDPRRSYLHTRALDEAFAHPLGVGVGTYGVNLPVLQPRPEVPYPHNVVYEIFNESGIFALGAFIALVWACGVAALRSAGKPGCAFCTVGLTFALVEAFASGDVLDDSLLWMTLGAALGIAGGYAAQQARRDAVLASPAPAKLRRATGDRLA